MNNRIQSITDSILGVLIAGLILGFFGLLYEKSTQTDKLIDRIEVLEVKLDNTQNELIKAIIISDTKSNKIKSPSLLKSSDDNQIDYINRPEDIFRKQRKLKEKIK